MSEQRETQEDNVILTARLQPAIQAGFVCIDPVSTARSSVLSFGNPLKDTYFVESFSPQFTEKELDLVITNW